MQCAAAAVTHEMVHFRAEARKDMHQLLQQPQQPLLFHIPLSPLPPFSLSLSSLLIAFVIGHRVPYIHPTVDRARSLWPSSNPGPGTAPHKLSSSCRSLPRSLSLRIGWTAMPCPTLNPQLGCGLMSFEVAWKQRHSNRAFSKRAALFFLPP